MTQSTSPDLPATGAAPDERVIRPEVPPSGFGCVECLAHPEGWWVHLRRCAWCGHIGCCDTSPEQHATRHAHESGHPVARSFEPGESWFWDYERNEPTEPADGVDLVPPVSRPVPQGSPAPRDRVPADWRRRIHRVGVEPPPEA
ncbi:UBP-type zinc finger domain-containing protein [Agromyces sp. MMS24-K17]|uniref:UBP-type zinc finger domain-containing protein n=1 Tax=Agromyces sp. MMS24-K17 TaxID=3372850 RepID=UPI0037547443